MEAQGAQAYTPAAQARSADLLKPIAYLLYIRPVSCLACGFTWVDSQLMRSFRAVGVSGSTRLEPVLDRLHSIDRTLGFGTTKLPVRYEHVCHMCWQDVVEAKTPGTSGKLAPSQIMGVVEGKLRIERIEHDDPDKFVLRRVWPPLRPVKEIEAKPATAKRIKPAAPSLDDL